MRDIEFKALILAKLKKMEQWADTIPTEGRSYKQAEKKGYLGAISELKREIIEIQKDGILNYIPINK